RAQRYERRASRSIDRTDRPPFSLGKIPSNTKDRISKARLPMHEGCDKVLHLLATRGRAVWGSMGLSCAALCDRVSSDESLRGRNFPKICLARTADASPRDRAGAPIA